MQINPVTPQMLSLLLGHGSDAQMAALAQKLAAYERQNPGAVARAISAHASGVSVGRSAAQIPPLTEEQWAKAAQTAMALAKAKDAPVAAEPRPLSPEITARLGDPGLPRPPLEAAYNPMIWREDPPPEPPPPTRRYLTDGFEALQIGTRRTAMALGGMLSLKGGFGRRSKIALLLVLLILWLLHY
ncbi:hypothetical protein ACMA5I_12450 [Paracoccaceae bacterium GXU_MW_L88]